MWAPAIVEKDGKYYLFFSANDVHEGETGGIGVAVSQQPEGPYRDALGRPLIQQIVNGAQPIDQFVFRDDDGQCYMYYGGWGHCNVVRLADDLLSIVPFADGETFKEVTPERYVEGPFMLKRQGKYYFMWSEGGWGGPDYCVSYAISDSPLGPFRRIGKILEQDPEVGTGAGHHSVVCVGNDEWYIIYHRRPLGETDANHRVTCIDRMEFDNQGFIKKVTITKEGVKAAKQIGMPVAVNYQLRLKQPGNDARTWQLTAQNDGLLKAASSLPLTISQQQVRNGNDVQLTLRLTAQSDVYFNIGAEIPTGFKVDDCDFYLPGFWYHKNLRSPREAPSFHTSKSWNVREDRLSSPLTGVYEGASGRSFSVMRVVDEAAEALTTHQEGEVIVSGNTSLGYVGFDNESGRASLTFGYPYVESPRRYVRKLTLINPITAFVKLKKGETKVLKWTIREDEVSNYGEFVARTWEYCMDCLHPEPIQSQLSGDEVKAGLSNYFRRAYVDNYDLKFHSGHGLRTDDCKPVDHVQLGFCGRVLLNGFNALEYGEAKGDSELMGMGNAIFDSWLEHGFTAKGYFKEDMHIRHGIPADEDCVHSIRQQSEAVYAVFHYLRYEKLHGRKHKEWEQKMCTLLDNMVTLLKEDGHYARKFRDDGSDVDASGGSTPSATSTLVMGYKYFGDKRYLQAAKRTVDYLEREIISKSDYFSSTLDANCEDKEAAISAVTATYYLAMVTKGQERQRYTELCKRAAYFALSWYYLWDVPFAEGQMLGDLGFQSRGWSNVSVENNHVDVFVFELAHIVKWLAEETNEPRFARIYDVIRSSLTQLLPTDERLCGIGVAGFNPEVVQHTQWDYGKNGKGFYNDIFAPGWTVASLWELFSPERTVGFLTGK